MKKNEILAGLELELRRGTLVLCVLSQLQEPMYGYNLVATLSRQGIPVEANTLYPLLRRLEGQGLLESSWETGESKPRKYYKTTEMGLEVYQWLRRQWEQSAESITRLLQNADLRKKDGEQEL